MAVQLGYKNVYRDPLGYPQWQAAGLPVATSVPAGLAGVAEGATDPGPLHGWAMLWTLLGIFAGGMALNLTPCVYPMIPITVSYFGGQAINGGGRGRLVINGLSYMLGLALTNSSLGVMAALTGGLMGAVLQNPLILAGVAGVLVLFASSLFGLWELRLPSGLIQVAAKTYGGYCGSLFMGMTLGVVAAPCIGPFVLGLLTWVASMGSPWVGFVVFFTLSLGLGLPLFLLALFSGQLKRLPRSGGWMEWVRKLMGWVLVAMAAHFLGSILPGTGGTLLLAAVAVAAGLHLAWVDRSEASFFVFPLMKGGVGIGAMVIAAALVANTIMRGPGVTWRPLSEAVLKEAQTLAKPVIIDFSASWCTPCRELDEVTFRHPEVVRLAENGFFMVKADVTQGGNPFHEELLKRYAVKGVPTVIFLDAEGQERGDLRLVDYLPAEQFLLRMQAVGSVAR